MKKPSLNSPSLKFKLDVNGLKEPVVLKSLAEGVTTIDAGFNDLHTVPPRL